MHFVLVQLCYEGLAVNCSVLDILGVWCLLDEYSKTVLLSEPVG